MEKRDSRGLHLGEDGVQREDGDVDDKIEAAFARAKALGTALRVSRELKPRLERHLRRTQRTLTTTDYILAKLRPSAEALDLFLYLLQYFEETQAIMVMAFQIIALLEEYRRNLGINEK